MAEDPKPLRGGVFVTVRELQVGDRIVDNDGEVARITNIGPFGREWRYITVEGDKHGGAYHKEWLVEVVR